MPPNPQQSSLVIAHVLFMDIVRYSMLYVDQQTAVIDELEDLIKQTAEFSRFRKTGQLVPLPAGDGVALVFFEDVLSPVRCAVELSQALKGKSIKLRMGIHSGPVYRRTAINRQRNVAGSGINFAQRVMDCGDEGHILLSDRVAGYLLELSEWSPRLQPLGKAVAKHDVELYLYNLYFDDIGNPALPRKLTAAALNLASTDAPYNIPPIDDQTFTGRKDELTKLEEILVKGAGNKRCSVIGREIAGGVGKTTLAHYFAEQHRDDFRDGIISLPVGGDGAGTSALDVNALARNFLAYCEEEPRASETAAMTMRRVCGERQMLLVFDNADDAALRSLLPGGNKCAVIVTTRRRDLVESLSIPRENRIELGVLSAEEAVSMLEKIVGADRVAAELPAAKKLVAAISYLPLAIRIAGITLLERPGKDSIAAYAHDLEDKKRVLDEMKFSTDVQLDLRASIAISLGPLDDADREFFARLSVCSEEGFSVRAAMAANACDERTAQSVLDKLYFVSLLNLAPPSHLGLARYVFHPLIRLYAQHYASNRESARGVFLIDDARRCHAKYYEDLVLSDALNNTPDVILAELSEITIAASWWQEKRYGAGHKAINRMLKFFEQRGYWQQAVELLSIFVRIAEQSGDKMQTAAYRIRLGAALRDCKEFARALAELEPVASILDRIQPESKRLDLKAMLKNTRGTVLQHLDRFEEAEAELLECIAIREEMGDSKGLAYALNSLGTLYSIQKQFDKAKAAIDRSLQIRRSGDPKDLAHTLQTEAGAMLRNGDTDGAENTYREALEIFQQVNFPRGVAMARTGLGQVLLRKDQFEAAIKEFEQSLELEKALSNEPGVALVKTEMGKAWLFKANKPARAVEYLADAFEIELRKKNRRGVDIVTALLVKALTRLGRADEARDYKERAVKLAGAQN